MNKTAIKNFSVWARKRLIGDVKYRASLMGITENGIAKCLPQSSGGIEFYDIGTSEPFAIKGEEIRQRQRLVERLENKEKDSNYSVAYKYIVEEVAYTWFNRLIAVRFMEVNDYLPSHVRVLSSESGKLEPDIVTTPFDSDLDFSRFEEEKIVALKQENKIDELFRMLFVKQCNALNMILPVLFEKTSDYTELLLNLSVVDQDGVVYHLVHDIEESNFNIEQGGQVEIIGWLYQYYNTEPKNEVFAKKGKITKEEIPAVTQLFTPDWIVRYMVENSLGRLWIEGHPNDELKSSWKYYLDEAEQESSVEMELAAIRKEYTTLKPEEIKVMDPCMGSGHILVYAFEILMQIYENAGWSQREAAKSIIEHNIYGLDIDDRAAQLAYFAVMMKARQYNRRILSADVKSNLYSVQESNRINRDHLKYFGADLSEIEKKDATNQIISLLDAFKDAKEYGSILNIEEKNWELLSKFIFEYRTEEQMSFDSFGIDKTQNNLKVLVNIGKLMAQKYEVVITNPPYMSASGMDEKLSSYIKKNYSESKGDLYTVFIEKCSEIAKAKGYIAMITQHGWMFLSGYEKLRIKMQQLCLINMVHLGAKAFEEISGEVVQTTAFVFNKSSKICNFLIKFSRLVKYSSQKIKEDEYFLPRNIFMMKQKIFENIPACRWVYWIKNMKIWDQEKIKKNFYSEGRNKTHNNQKYVREWWELNSLDDWAFYMNGGNYRKWYGNLLDMVSWKETSKREYALHGGLVDERNVKKYGISWNGISGNIPAFRIKPANVVFSSSSPTIIPNMDYKPIDVLCALNSKACRYILNALNPTLQLNVGEVLDLPYIGVNNLNLTELGETCIHLAKLDWDAYELSNNFIRHPLIYGKKEKLISDKYKEWQEECNNRFNTLKANEEQLNKIFIDIYGLQDELSPEVEDKDVTVRKADLKREIKSLLSYAVGCMFGRYSLKKEGLMFAGGKMEDIYQFHSGKLDSSSSLNGLFPMDGKSYYYLEEDDYLINGSNIIPITDEEYLEDDIVSLLCTWLKKAYGQDTLEENLDFIASVLDNKGNTSREVIRNYFLKDFFKDHCTTYSVTGSGKRPIYWLFDSGKQNGFKALIYMHRYNTDTIGTIRVDYLHRMEQIYESEINRMQDTIDHSNAAREITTATKRKEKLQKQLKECREFDEKIGHLALSRIEIDLDDGVKVNYEKIQTADDGKKYQVLAKI